MNSNRKRVSNSANTVLLNGINEPITVEHSVVVKKETKSDKRSVFKMEEETEGSEDIFEEGEDVLAWHGPAMFRAKVLRVSIRDGVRSYQIHYQGWNRKWNENVKALRMLKFTPENEESRRALMEAQTHQSRKVGRGATGEGSGEDRSDSKRKSSIDVGSSKKKRKFEEGVQPAHEAETSDEVRFPLPPRLERVLADDWNSIVREKMTVRLPPADGRASVTDILNAFLAHRRKRFQKDETQKNDAEIVVKGISKYFEACLSTILLYRQERAQYQALIRESPPGTSMCDLYGGEHLLRLFVKLPELFSETTLSQAELKALISRLSEFVKFLVTNASTYFKREYERSSLAPT